MRVDKHTIRSYVTDLTPRIRDYLIKDRGLTPPIIWQHQLGYWPSRQGITIPIFNRRNQLAFFKVARGPDASADIPKMWCFPAGSPAELYGWEHVKSPGPEFLVICEGEFDRLVLESHGIPAVTGTAGAGVFLSEWAEALAPVQNIFVCYDRDEAGEHGVELVTGLLPQLKVIELPEDVGPGGDITDFFTRLGKSVSDFRRLLAEAEPLPEECRVRVANAVDKESQSPQDHVTRTESDPRVAYIKTNVSIDEIAKTYIPKFHQSGRTLVGRCIFHVDEHPSLVLYPEKNRFHCYGCGTHGDVIQFVMEAECLSFSQALQVLEDYLKRS